jgi:hypothetical protein
MDRWGPFTPDQRADKLAAKQRALLTHQQALWCGLSIPQIQNRRESGRWVDVCRELYRVAGAPVTWQQAALAPCLIGPQGTVASHLTAAALVDLVSPSWRPHATTGRRGSVRLPIATWHRAEIANCDRSSVGGIPITTVPRTIVDCATLLGEKALADLVDSALCSGRATKAAIEVAMLRASPAGRRPGLPLLRQVLAAWASEITAGSAAEVRLLRLLAQWGYPPPEKQVAIRDASGRVVAILDLAWRPRQVGVEYDSPRFHSPRRWVHDEQRHIIVEALGWSLVHADKADLMPGERAFRDALQRAWYRSAA